MCAYFILSGCVVFITDVDDCLAESVCPVGSQCDNSLGSYSCQCDAGLTMDGDSCKGTVV